MSAKRVFGWWVSEERRGETGASERLRERNVRVNSHTDLSLEHVASKVPEQSQATPFTSFSCPSRF